ncbi:MAG TPA: Uma2 family endonuclease, partial [Chloroflexota bacterium]|nr:Uma2 family endonuclease [Chloroflexota bacterium]
MSTQPHFYHQLTCVATIRVLDRWNADTAAGRVAIAPGVVFAEDDDVAPDLVWISKARLAATLRSDGHLHAAPELVVEVLSPGPVNERRDLVAKLALYARRGVD